MEKSYTNEKLRIYDKFWIPQDNLYIIAWEAESNAPFLYRPKLYRDTMTLKFTRNQDFVIQHDPDGNFSQRHNDAPDVFNDELHSDKHSSQDHNNTQKLDSCENIDALS